MEALLAELSEGGALSFEECFIIGLMLTLIITVMGFNFNSPRRLLPYERQALQWQQAQYERQQRIARAHVRS